MTLKNSTGRRRGGQPGNKNNLRHGFYARLYCVADGKALKKCELEDELALARFKARRLAELTPLKGPIEDLLAQFPLLGILNNYLITINTIERTRMLEKGRGGSIGDTIMQVLLEMNPDEDLE